MWQGGLRCKRSPPAPLLSSEETLWRFCAHASAPSRTRSLSFSLWDRGRATEGLLVSWRPQVGPAWSGERDLPPLCVRAQFTWADDQHARRVHSVQSHLWVQAEPGDQVLQVGPWFLPTLETRQRRDWSTALLRWMRRWWEKDLINADTWAQTCLKRSGFASTAASLEKILICQSLQQEFMSHFSAQVRRSSLFMFLLAVSENLNNRNNGTILLTSSRSCSLQSFCPHRIYQYIWTRCSTAHQQLGGDAEADSRHWTCPGGHGLVLLSTCCHYKQPPTDGAITQRFDWLFSLLSS